MPISVTCPSCASRVRLPDDAAGRRFRCPKCRGAIAGPPAAGFRPPVVRPPGQIEAGFVDSPPDPAEGQTIDEPAPISSAVRKATDSGFNPFDDKSDPDADGTRPRGRRPRKPRDEYNPFAEPPAETSAAGGADTGQPFDFGAPDPSESAPAGEFDFGPVNPADDGGPRRRRR